MSGFYLPSDAGSQRSSRASSSASGSSLSSTLPFPAPLPRADFLAADFDPSAYLSALGNRHQTLEDLRNDLRERSQLLSKELLELVNEHADDFLRLGGSLKGGEDKIEEVRVGLMGVRREVGGVRKVVLEREEEVARLVAERRSVRREIDDGMQMLAWEERLGALEGRLLLEDGREAARVDTGAGEDESDDESLEGLAVGDDDNDTHEDDLEDLPDPAVARLRRRVGEYAALQRLAKRIGEQHPFVIAQQSRMMRVRNTLLLDLSTALKQYKTSGDEGTAGLLRVMGLYRDMGAQKEAVDSLRGLRTR